MKKIIKLTESDLTKIIKRVIMEQSLDCQEEWGVTSENLEKLYHNNKVFICGKVKEKSKLEQIIKLKLNYFDTTKLDCMFNKFNEWCRTK
jgi:hypothetical protein